MVPRGDNRRRKVRNPIPVWIPLPRPCLRSLNTPDPPYYIPMTPGMYLPWNLPPSYFTKPICHCANENFCTSSNCRNATECRKLQPIFCPHESTHEETEIVRNRKQEQETFGNDKETSSNSDTNICSPGPTAGLRTLCKKDYSSQDNRGKSQEKNYNNQKIQPNLRAVSSSKKRTNDCADTSCQTFSNSQTRINKRSCGLGTSPAGNPKNYLNRNDVTKSEFSCSSNADSKKIVANDFKCPANSMPIVDGQEFDETTENFITSNIHLDQISEQLSNARKLQVSKYNDCCLAGSTKTCEANMDIDTKSKSDIETPTSNCGCYSVNGPEQSSFKSPKLLDCKCSSSKLTFKETIRFGKKPKCKCIKNKIQHKLPSRIQKLSKCGCFSTKVNKKKSCNLLKVSECLCPSTDIVRNLSPDYRRVSANESTSTEGGIKNVMSFIKVNNGKYNKDVQDITSSSATNVKQSSCQCKFPPAYENLSCSGKLSNNCSCTNT